MSPCSHRQGFCRLQMGRTKRGTFLGKGTPNLQTHKGKTENGREGKGWVEGIRTCISSYPVPSNVSPFPFYTQRFTSPLSPPPPTFLSSWFAHPNSSKSQRRYTGLTSRPGMERMEGGSALARITFSCEYRIPTHHPPSPKSEG